ncbi:hypothetical protein [Microbacterium sp. H1-D42]|uniref:hypothetical protein n=1 Tax=Microbacterium sp. H1-D42 TaxID=2925844 RepID=UPI001F5391B6|nr:hypothetical protein [Microbacterium sp. H1-D42]UNK70337.1 hypothetical protein MNR00_14400 [Microbacterium sp. H1-D42]
MTVILRASDGALQVVIEPEQGGRITSIRGTGREWLAPASPRDPATGFSDAGSGGWDEVAPTVAACRLPSGRELPDHGDIWRLPWSVLDSGIEHCTMSVALTSLPLTLTRTIVVAPDRVRLKYSTESSGAEASGAESSDSGVPLLWSAHPLFAAHPGTRIETDATMITEDFPRAGLSVEWAGALAIDDVSGAQKWFASDASVARIRHADGSLLEMTWSSATLPRLGLFWDTGVFEPHPVVALEPTTGRRDDASAIIDELPRVGPRQALQWWVELRVRRAEQAPPLPPRGDGRG